MARQKAILVGGVVLIICTVLVFSSVTTGARRKVYELHPEITLPVPPQRPQPLDRPHFEQQGWTDHNDPNR